MVSTALLMLRKLVPTAACCEVAEAACLGGVCVSCMGVSVLKGGVAAAEGNQLSCYPKTWVCMCWLLGYPCPCHDKHHRHGCQILMVVMLESVTAWLPVLPLGNGP